MPISYRRSGMLKPPLGATINWGHPLAQNLIGAWLFNEAGGSVVNSLVDQNDSMTLSQAHGGSAAPLWIPATGRGDMMLSLGQQGGDTSSVPYLSVNLSPTIKPTDVISLFWGGQIFGDSLGSNNPYFISDNANFCYGFARRSGGGHGNDIIFLFDIGGATTPIVTGVLTYNVWQTIGQSLKSGSQLGYVNGVQQQSATQTGSLGYGGTTHLWVGTDNSGQSGASTECSNTGPQVIYMWHRFLTANEYVALHAEPYSLIDWHTPRLRKVFGRPYLPTSLSPWTDAQMPQLLPQ